MLCNSILLSKFANPNFYRKMKQLKFLMVALTLLMGISLTSCLDSDSESAWDRQGYARAVYGTYFIDLEGNTYYPTTASLVEMETKYGFKMASSDLVHIAFKFVDDTSTSPKSTSTTAKKYTIQLVSAASIDSYNALTVNNTEELENASVENAPIVTLNPQSGFGEYYSPGLYGDEMLILPIQWKMENSESTLAQHTFTLVSVSDDEDANKTTLVFYLRHNRGTDTKTDAYASRTKAYDIEHIISNFKAEKGNYPTKIIIKAKVDLEGKTLPEQYTEYTIDNCKFE